MRNNQIAGAEYDGEIDLLADRQRRSVLRQLVQGSRDRASVDELVEHLADDPAFERGVDPETARIDLYHRVLPKLADRGVIEYDARSGSVRYHPNDRIEDLMECLPGD